jgi:plastocyanin
MSYKKLLLVLLIIGIIVMVGGISYINKLSNKKMSSPSHTTSKNILMSMYRKGTDTIIVTKTGFSPQQVVIAAGSKVIWVNNSGADVTVNSDNYPANNLYPFLNLGRFSNNFSVQLVFNKRGTYSYHDQLNPTWKGMIIVK